MCPTDPSKITLGSQMELLDSLCRLINSSSCPSLIRDSGGSIIYVNSNLKSIALKESGVVDIMETLNSLDLKRLSDDELKVVTYGGTQFVEGVILGRLKCDVLIEVYSSYEGKFTKWSFMNFQRFNFSSVRDTTASTDFFKRDFFDFYKDNPVKRSVMLLHTFGFTHNQIAVRTGFSEKTSRNYSRDVRKALNVSSQDELIFFQIKSSLHDFFAPDLCRALHINLDYRFKDISGK